MTNRRPTACTVAVVLMLLAAAPASAQEQTYRACYVPNVGAIYLIGLADLPSECLASTHVEISWREGEAAITDHGNLTGLTDDDHPEYVREGEAAGGDLSGAFPEPMVTALRGQALSSTAPGEGQVLVWNATGGVWEPRTPATGVTDHGNLTGLADDDHTQYVLADGVRGTTNGFAVTGTYSSGSIPVEGAGTRIMWYPGKAAFRAGRVSETFGTAWDDTNVGLYSTAIGVNTIASGYASTALGFQIEATGSESTAMGSATNASGHASTAMGYYTDATGDFSTAMGRLTNAQAYASVVIGQHSPTYSGWSSTSWVGNDPLFVAGNGSSSSSRSFALHLKKNGDMRIAGTLTESSDRRLKLGIEPLGSVLSELGSIRPVRFRFREGTGHPADPQIGLIAQEVAEAFPELVATDREGYLSLAYPKLTAVLVRAIQEQQETIEAQREELDAQAALLAEMEARLTALEREIRRP